MSQDWNYPGRAWELKTRKVLFVILMLNS